MCDNLSAKMSKAQLFDAIDKCDSIAEIFSLVKQADIDIRMQTLCSASCVPPKELSADYSSPEEALQRLKEAVRFAIESTQ